MSAREIKNVLGAKTFKKCARNLAETHNHVQTGPWSCVK